MNLTISTDDADLTLALEGWSPPPSCETLYVNAPNARKAVNFLLQSPVNCRVVFRFPEAAINMAGLFSMCIDLQHQPVIEGLCAATSLAAAFKANRECRYSMHWLAPITSGCRDYRQMFWGAVNFSGNGVQDFDFSNVTSPLGMRNFFGGGSSMRTEYYDLLIQEWYDLLEQDRLPLPMSPVDMGNSICSPYVADMRLALIESGWDIQDGGVKEDERNWFEVALSDDFDSMLPDWERRVDTDCVATTSQGGILITERHLLYCDHWAPTPGKVVRLRSGEERGVINVTRNSGWDLSIAELDKPVVAEPVALLPADAVADMPLALGPPSRYQRGQAPAVVFFNRNNHASVCDLSWVHRDEISVQFREPASEARQELFVPIAVGDSGSPLCFVYQSQLVLIGVVTHPGTARFLTTAPVRQWMESVTGRQLRIIEV